MGQDDHIADGNPPLPIARTLIWLGCAGAGLGSMRLVQLRPEWVERYYSRGVYPPVRRTLSWISGHLSFSLAEALILMLAAYLLWSVGKVVVSMARGRTRWWRALASAGLLLVRVSSAVLIAFLLLWGLNHARQPLSVSAKLPEVADKRSALKLLVGSLAQDLMVDPRERGGGAPGFAVFSATGDPDPRIRTALHALTPEVPSMEGEEPALRRIGAWPIFARLGISGIFSPFTGEPHFNGGTPACQWPFEALHEIAHQRGFAREDEANFLAWWLCISSGNEHYRYSGNLAALSLALGAIWRDDPEFAADFVDSLPGHVRSDMRAVQEFWQRYQSPVRAVGSKLNDAYLKSQGQSHGVRSYGRMLDLMLSFQARGR
ncbi:MAG: DUF3810 domain-containing protein [bacterium]|nr:DUF3810 domain-containing protein [bacterium]